MAVPKFRKWCWVHTPRSAYRRFSLPCTCGSEDWDACADSGRGYYTCFFCGREVRISSICGTRRERGPTTYQDSPKVSSASISRILGERRGR
jgi:hypothetical protein